ncbi:class I SAM-dependent methyltransferase [Actinomycetospora rhizophila]|uniref:Class I SAM-dependent methyltransferase n=1 Tax=Actinomycetospora rhizophila TaxID=1416876 RepID=A0ABV9Z6E1_9PSEU
MSTTAHETTDQQLTAKHRALWASGDYPAVADDLIPTLAATLVDAAGVHAGQRVLDVGRRIATQRGVELDRVEAGAEPLPFADAGFDVMLSCVGAMFAPHHQAVADELIRVTRPGGTIGMINWAPPGFIGQLFATMKPYAPPPPPARAPPHCGATRSTSAPCSATASQRAQRLRPRPGHRTRS